MKTSLCLGLLLALLPPSQEPRGELTAFAVALQGAERALEGNQTERARLLIDRALERDAKSPDAWRLAARWAEAVGDRDERVYALHREYRLLSAQGMDRRSLRPFREALLAADPLASDLLELHGLFVTKLEKAAQRYEKEGRPHSAIGLHKEILALDPEYAPSQEAIERIAAAPDPSLAEFAKPKDLFADVSDEWIAEHDVLHDTWATRAHRAAANYDTYTDAGYRVLLMASEAMEQMNAFYREFFRYGTEDDGRAVPRIALNIFKTRDEYLELGQGPPVEWSGGHYTGSAVETYVSGDDPRSMFGTLFHEAAHQFVGLATSAAGWLNEGLASFFEGCRILPNGTVHMNLPADHRLFPLAQRMERGWMRSADEGLDPSDPGQTPERAPTFRIVLENRYSWGPPWYAPTWGVVFFLYNYQDEYDGRFVYREAFQDFVDTSGGRQGEGAIENFEEVVLGNPQPPIRGVDRPEDAAEAALPESVEELDEVWKEWMVKLSKERSGAIEVSRPYHRWATFAMAGKNWSAAKEHFEKGLVETRGSEPAMLVSFAELLAERFDDEDRAARLVLDALRLMERAEEPDAKLIRSTERFLGKLDPKRKTLDRLHADLLAAVEHLVQRYDAVGLDKMVMHLSWKFGIELGAPGLFDYYQRAVERSGKSLQLFKLAYNEKNLDGWSAAGTSVFEPDGTFLSTHLGEYDERGFDYQILTLDELSSGDFSLEAEVLAVRGKVNFCGLVFGRKGTSDFHALILFPGKPGRGEEARGGFLDLSSFFGAGTHKVWRHHPVQTENPAYGGTSAGRFHRLRVDVSGSNVDYWVDGELQGSHVFASREVAAGSLGLITGPGAARFRNVRYLSRHPRDPAGGIEREVRLERLRTTSGDGGLGGSFLGMHPPWPRVERWLRAPRESWDDYGPAPQLLVLWSIHQNGIVPIDGWLRDLAERTELIDLRFVCVASPNDSEALDAYLEEHPFPGSVAVDRREGVGIGDTFEAYSLLKFHLPRLLLLDLDGKVVWEGDPGFERAEPWQPGMKSYLYDSLEELSERRQLRQIARWRRRWFEEGLGKLREGDLESALPMLKEARDFGGGLVAEVDLAVRQLTALEGALDAFESTCFSVSRERAEPALLELLEWAPELGREQDRKLLRDLSPQLEGRHARDWQEVLRQIGRYRKLAEPGEEARPAAIMLGELRSLQGRFRRSCSPSWSRRWGRGTGRRWSACWRGLRGGHWCGSFASTSGGRGTPRRARGIPAAE